MPPLGWRKPASERFWSFVDRVGLCGCWEWTGGTVPNGYGRFVDDDHRKVLAHRWAFDRFVRAIPPGYEVDHLCRNRACVNPDHLEAVPPHVNKQRARVNTCKRGHSLTGANIRVRKDGHRECVLCKRLRDSVRPAPSVQPHLSGVQ